MDSGPLTVADVAAGFGYAAYLVVGPGAVHLIKIVSIIEHTRECLGGLVERSITGGELAANSTVSPPSAAAILPYCGVTTDPN